MHDPHLHNGPFQVLIPFLKSFKDCTHLTLGGNLLPIFASYYSSESFSYFMVLKVSVSCIGHMYVFSTENMSHPEFGSDNFYTGII